MSLSQFRQGRLALSMYKQKTTAFLFTQVNLLNVWWDYSNTTTWQQGSSSTWPAALMSISRLNANHLLWGESMLLLITTKECGEEHQWRRMQITCTSQGNSSGGKQQKNACFLNSSPTSARSEIFHNLSAF